MSLARLNGLQSLDNQHNIALSDIATLTRMLNATGLDSGANLIGYKNRTVYDRLSEEAHISDFAPGAKGTPGIDNTANLQLAIDTIPDRATLVLPAGQWDFTNLKVTRPLFIKGAGGASTVLNKTALTGRGLEFVTSPAGLYKAGLLDLMVTSTVKGTSGSVCWMGNVGHGIVENVYVTGFTSEQRPYQGIVFSGTTQTSIHNLQVNDCAAAGVSVRDHCVDLYWTNSRSDNNGGAGFQFESSEGMYLTNCTSYLNTGASWSFKYNALSPNRNYYFTNCIGDSSSVFNWAIEDMQTAFWVNCWGCTQKDASVNYATGFFAQKAAGATLTKLHFMNCNAVNNNSHGFAFIGANRVSLIGCSGEGNGVLGASAGLYVSISNGVKSYASEYLSNSGAGVVIGSSCPGVVISGGLVQYNAGGTIQTGTVGTRIIDVEGFLNANSGAAYLASGATTIAVTHGLAITPLASSIHIMPTTTTTNDTGNFWISAVTATTFTLSVRNDPGATGLQFQWCVNAPVK